LNLLLNQTVEGGPSWIESDTYEIDATSESAPGQAAMRGPMLQGLLEDRFHLKIRREAREGAVYALTVAKSGLKLAPSKPGDCSPPDYGLPTPYPQFCGAPKRGDHGLHLIGATMTDLCRILSAPEISDRTVIDRTGVSGLFDIPLPGPGELRGATSGPRDGRRADSSQPTQPSTAELEAESPFEAIRSALQKFGLNLERSRGTAETRLIIEHVERPAEN
jgi:uncharacterized protein (TIGR03435 family)